MRGETTYALSIGMMALAVCLSFFSNYFLERFAAYEDFQGTAVTSSFRAACSVVAVCGFALIWGLTGAVFGYLLHEILTLGFSLRRSRRTQGPVGISFDWEQVKAAIVIGFPISITWYMFILQNSADRAVLGALLPSTQVGYYGLGSSLTSLFGLVPLAVGRVLYPRVNFAVVKASGTESISRLVVGSGLSLAMGMAFMQAAILGALPLVYNYILPAYREGLLAGEILICGVFSVGLVRTGANYLIATDQQSRVILYAAVTLAVNVCLNVVLIGYGFGLAGVAFGTAVSGLLLNCLTWRRAMAAMGLGKRAVWLNLGLIYFPQAILVAQIFGYRLIVPGYLVEFTIPTVAMSVLLVASQGLVLWLIPRYRVELAQWGAFVQKQIVRLGLAPRAV
jgi:O-antigen/teichoic acid export membrane protein